MPKVSVLTVFKRPKGEELVGKCLLNQTFEDWEWIQVTPLTNTLVLKNTKVIPEPKANPGDVWNLNKAYNAGFRACEGELIVSIQDEVWFPEEGLEKFWMCYQEEPKGCVTGVGDKYQRLDDFGKPEVKLWADPRKYNTGFSFYEVNPNDWELNYASVPTQAMYDIGGFDESFDGHYGWDNVDVAIRLDHFDYKFFIDKSNESRSLIQTRPADWEEKNAYAGNAERDTVKMNNSFFMKIQKERAAGRYPFKMEYLKRG